MTRRTSSPMYMPEIIFSKTCLPGASGIIQNSTHINLYITSSGNGIFQQLDYVLINHTSTVETLSPGDQQTLGEAQLCQGEGESEAQRQTLLVDVMLVHKVGQTLGDMIKQLCARAQHNMLGNGVDARLHLEVMFLLQMNQQDSEICATKVKCQELATFVAIGQILYVGDETLDIRLLVGLLGQTFFNFMEYTIS
ncbi:hypothetical protein FF38_08637 [Lucilia cuprina]|uniref:Uncharacterized protein n=1 Tax=Lucilia cuprina TaxID=7375 RepID=A0A0L0C2M6_LUCCU|nr:hypothetical protein FF38_08637 [Lucilia cuprina]